MTSVTDCITCDAGFACSVGSAVQKACLPGSYGAAPGQATCDLCEPGKFTPDAGNTACRNCTSGYLCVEGSSAPQPCPGGTHADQTVLASVGFLSNLTMDCKICPPGTSCSVGSAEPTRCLPGSIAPEANQETCDLCPQSQFQREYGQTACVDCLPGFYCKTGSAEPVPCPAGYVGNATGLYSPGQCTPVPRGFWAPLGSSIPETCPASGFYCPGALRDDLYGGAKPIIMPVGQSTETQEVATVQQTMTLDLSLDHFAAQREALKIRLAAQYGVDPALITLEVSVARRRVRALQSSGLELTITIATSDGAGNEVEMEVIEQAAAAVDATALTTAISEVTIAAGLPPVTVSALAAPERTTASIEVPFSCPLGKWCTAGLVVDCPLGTYNPLMDQDFATACIMCPQNSYTRGTSSTSRAACVCNGGFYDANSSTAIDQDLIDAMIAANSNPITMIADVVECLECPVGTTCTQGSTLEGLPLLTGYYRLDNTSVDVRACPDSRKNCSTTFGTAQCVSSSGCQGGQGNPCAPGLTGTYCQLCDELGDALVSYTQATDDEVATCKDCGDTLASTMIGAAVVLAVMIVAVVIVLIIGRTLSAKHKRQLTRINQTFTPKNKLKVIVGCYQLTTKISSVYDVSLPPDINEFLESLSTGLTLGVQGVATTPLECLGFSGYLYRLIFWMAVPAVLVVVVVLAISVQTVVKSLCHKKAVKAEDLKKEDDHGAAFHLSNIVEDEREPSFFEKTLPAVLTLLFVVYPVVTKNAFDGFPCYRFENGREWLIADVSVECVTSPYEADGPFFTPQPGSPDHSTIQLIAWVTVILYPIGIWVFCAFLLYKASPTILAGKETPLSRAIGFLHKEYEPTCFWWELMEMLRKFLLVGLFVTLMPGTIMQISIGTIVSAVYLMIQLQASPYKSQSDDYVAVASSFSLLMVFVCSIIYKYDALTSSEELQAKMSIEQTEDFIVDNTALTAVLVASVFGSLVFSSGLVAVQIIMEIKNNAKLRRLKYTTTGKWVELPPAGHGDPQAFHLFLSHAWPAAQDRMRIVKGRFLECLPSCRTFLDVDDLKSGSGTAEVDKSECILVFCTSQYFEKKNSLKELYRAVCQRRPILAMLEPDATQEGGLDQEAVEALITNKKLDKFNLRKKWAEWKEEGELLPAAFDHAPDEAEVRAALFKMPPVEWNRLPHFQDVTIRLIAQNGILGGNGGELYLQGEAATGKILLAPPLNEREYHLFCSPFNAGAKEFAEELKAADVYVTKGKKVSAPLTYTTDVSKLSSCDHMLCLLDARTFTSGDDTAKFVEHIHEAMRIGVHVNCIHEFPAVVGPKRYECEFGLMFGDDWTPAHLTGGKTNLYKEIAFALKGAEWRQPGLVAVASKIAASAAEHKLIEVKVPDTYMPKKGPNKWKTKGMADQVEEIIRTFDSDRDYIMSVDELHALLVRTNANMQKTTSRRIYDDLLATHDTNQDGYLSIDEVAAYWAQNNLSLNPLPGTALPPPRTDKTDSFPPGDLTLNA